MEPVPVILLSPTITGTGNHTTCQRIAEALQNLTSYPESKKLEKKDPPARREIIVIPALDPDAGIHVERVISQKKVACIFGIHALKLKQNVRLFQSGRHLVNIQKNIPYAIILGGTDINEYESLPENSQAIVVECLRGASAVVAFSEELKAAAELICLPTTLRTVVVIPQAVDIQGTRDVGLAAAKTCLLSQISHSPPLATTKGGWSKPCGMSSTAVGKATNIVTSSGEQGEEKGTRRNGRRGAENDSGSSSSDFISTREKAIDKTGGGGLFHGDTQSKDGEEKRKIEEASYEDSRGGIDGGDDDHPEEWMSRHVFLLPASIVLLQDPMYLVRAFKLWSEENPSVHLVIVGAALDKHMLASLQDEIKDSPNITYDGLVSRRDVLGMISHPSCAGLLNTSKSEGMSGVILEAMALAKSPGIARAIPGNLALIEHNVTGICVRGPRVLPRE
eukprot:jgi/Bigna1/68216/fgenesh1_pg.5_\